MIPETVVVSLRWSNVEDSNWNGGLVCRHVAAGRYEFSHVGGLKFGHVVSIQTAISFPYSSEVTSIIVSVCKTHGFDRRGCDLRGGCEDFSILEEVPRWQSIATKIGETTFEVNTYHLPKSTTMEEARVAGPPVLEDVKFSVLCMSKPAIDEISGV